MTQDPKDLSVFGLDRRTNNCCESYHAQWNLLVPKAHPGCYDFAQHTNQMFENYQMELERVKANPTIPILRERRGDLEYRMARLRKIESDLTSGKITAFQFIDKNTHSADGIIAQAIDGQDDDEEDNENGSDYIENEEDFEQQQPNNPPVSMCLSCGEACVEKFFFGCGHYPYCQNCQGNPTCSLCNQDVQFRSRMLET